MFAVLPVTTPKQFVVWYERRGEGGAGLRRGRLGVTLAQGKTET